MAELMNEHEQKLFENLMAHNSAYYGYELSKGEIKTILQAFTELKKYRSTTEAEIRAKAIDEFAEKFVFQAVCQGCSGCCNCYESGRQMRCGEYQRCMEIAEQLKERE